MVRRVEASGGEHWPARQDAVSCVWRRLRDAAVAVSGASTLMEAVPASQLRWHPPPPTPAQSSALVSTPSWLRAWWLGVALLAGINGQEGRGLLRSAFPEMCGVLTGATCNSMVGNDGIRKYVDFFLFLWPNCSWS